MICDKCETVAHCMKNGCVPKTTVQQCNHCNGSGRMVRDPDIGTDQECFVCDGKGTVAPEQSAQQRTEELLEIFKDVDQCGPLLGMGGKKIGCVNHDCDQCKEQPAQEFVCSTGLCHYKSQGPWVHATTWRGLTDEEIIIMSRYDLEYAALIGEVQRKLKEKNT